MNEGILEKERLDAKENGYIERDVCGEVITSEAAGEYVLPDYQPEIRKILHVRAAVLPSGKYLGGAKAEFAGTVAHTVLYTDADRTESEWMNGIMTRCSWSLGEDTDIYVIQCQDVDTPGSSSGMGDYPYLCYVGFENPVVYEKMNAAIAAAIGQ